MKLRILSPIFVVALLVAGCGGGSAGKLQPSDVAIVDGHHITLSDYDLALAEQTASTKANGQAVPAAGSTSYAALKSSVIDQLVLQTEYDLQAQALGVKVTSADVDKLMTAFKKSCCKSNEKTYKQQLTAQHYTDAMVRQTLRERLVEQGLAKAVTKGVTATPAEIAAYYEENLSQYQQPATRAVEEILVGKTTKKLDAKALATTIYNELKAGKNFGTLAKQYSQDPGSKDKGGKFTATKGEDVAEFDAAVFATTAKTGVLLKPVNTAQYGWFVIMPLADIVPGKTTSEKAATASIRSTLNTTKKQTATQAWLTTMKKGYCGGKIKYQTAYTPVASADPCLALSTSVPTTT